LTTARYYIKSHSAAEQRVDSHAASRKGASRDREIVDERSRRAAIYARQVAAGDPIAFIPQTRRLAAGD
jgi:hypothetical protein